MRALRSHLYFRYDYRDYAETECGQFEHELCRLLRQPARAGGVQRHRRAGAGHHGRRHPARLADRLSRIHLRGHPERDRAGRLRGRSWSRWTRTCTWTWPTCGAAGTRRSRRSWSCTCAASPADLDALAEFAAEMGVPLIEDAVPALGAELQRSQARHVRGGRRLQHPVRQVAQLRRGRLPGDRRQRACTPGRWCWPGRTRGAARGTSPTTEPPLDADLDLPLLSLRMDEIRAALLRAELTRLPTRLAAFHRNYDYVAAALADLAGIAIRQPVAPGAYLGRGVHVPGTRTATPAGSPRRCAPRASTPATSARPTTATCGRSGTGGSCSARPDAGARSSATLPATAGYLAEAVDVPLSSDPDARRGLRPADHRGRAGSSGAARGHPVEPSRCADHRTADAAVPGADRHLRWPLRRLRRAHRRHPGAARLRPGPARRRSTSPSAWWSPRPR